MTIPPLQSRADATTLTVRLSGRLSMESTVLRLEYSVHNGGTDGVFVRSRPQLYGKAGRRPYSFLLGADTLLLSYLPSPIPPGLNIYAPVPVYSRRVGPLESLDDWLEIPLPVEERHAYCPLEYPEDSELVHVERLLFRTECCSEAAAGTPRPGPQEDPGLVYVWGDPAETLELAFETPVPVLKRQDEFHRP